MMGRQNAERIGLLTLMVPELFEDPGTVLYVGAYGRRFAGSQPLYQTGHEITVLEVWPPFIESLKGSRFAKRVFHYVEGDVTKLDEAALPHERFDYTVWLHGPEHVGTHEVIPAIQALEAITDKAMVLGMPWGWAPHNMAYDNPHTIHRSFWYPDVFQAIGYRTAALGPKDRLGSHLLAWKLLDLA